jgi:glutaconate CoA-transferase subunit A
MVAPVQEANRSKLVPLSEAAGLVRDGDLLALGGNVLHRAPMAFVRELIRQNKRGLRLMKTAGAHDIDLLCAAGCVSAVDAGFVSYETEFGLAMHYRKAVESGAVRTNEHACYTVISALRAAAIGAPFMPVAGLKEGDLIRENDDFRIVDDPFGGGPVTVVRALAPDVAVIHVQEADEAGNGVIWGPKFEDVLMTRAARKVVLTAERIVGRTRTGMRPEAVDIPGFLVEAVVHAPRGAAPCSCAKMYEADLKALEKFKKLDTGEIESFIRSYERADRSGRKAGAAI